jgi:hypothetical protein
MPSVGSNGQFGFAEETLWASGTPTINKFIPFLSESLKLEKNVVMTQSIRGSSSHSVHQEGANRVAGDLQVEVQPVGMWTLFKHALGRGFTAGPSGSGFYHHRILPSGALPEGLRVEVGRDVGGTFTYKGVKVNTVEMTCSVGEPLKATFGLLGKDEAQSTSAPTAPSATAISALSPYNFDQANTTVDGLSNSVEVTGFTLNVNNNLAEDKGKLGSKYRAAIPRNGFREVTGTLNVEFDNLYNYNRFINQTEHALQIRFTSDQFAAGTTAHQLDIILPRVVFTGETPVVSGPDLIYHNLPFIALYDSGEGDQEKDEVRLQVITSDATI